MVRATDGGNLMSHGNPAVKAFDRAGTPSVSNNENIVFGLT